MADITMHNPVTGDDVTLHAPLPESGTDPLVFTTRLPAGSAGSPPHRHARLAETFEVIEGVVTFRLGAAGRALAVGEAVTVRPGMVHGFRNASSTTALLRCTVTPGAGFEQFLRGMQSVAVSGRATAAGLPRDPRRLARLLLAADFHFPGLPMGLQQALFRVLAALSPTTAP